MDERIEREKRLEGLAKCPEGHDTRHYYSWLDDIDNLRKALAQKEAECAELKERVKELEAKNTDLIDSVAAWIKAERHARECAADKEAQLKYDIADLTRQLEESEKAQTTILDDYNRDFMRPLIKGKDEEISELKAQLNEPIHLGCFYNEEEGIKTIYILDKDGNETDRVVKAECLLKRISKYFNRAKSAEWWMDHGQKLRNAIADCIPLGEPCGDQALIDYPAKMKAQLEEARKKIKDLEKGVK